MANPKVPPRLHNAVSTMLLYGQHPWLTRGPGGHVTVTTGACATACGTNQERLRDSLYKLLDLGLLSRVVWQRHYFVVTVVPPVGMAWVTGDPTQEDPSSD